MNWSNSTNIPSNSASKSGKGYDCGAELLKDIILKGISVIKL
jgi:hypothetical protein